MIHGSQHQPFGNAATAEGLAHGDAADLVVFGLVDEAQRADHFTLGNGNEVGGGHIVGVVFLGFGHFLFPDEDFPPQCEGGVAQGREGRGNEDGDGHGDQGTVVMV